MWYVEEATEVAARKEEAAYFLDKLHWKSTTATLYEREEKIDNIR